MTLPWKTSLQRSTWVYHHRSSMIARSLSFILVLIIACGRMIPWSMNHHGIIATVAAGSVSDHDSSSSSSSTTPPPIGVITLTSKNFDSSLRDGNIWLIEFYAPWCSHCVRFASTYEQLAIQLHSMHDNDDDDDPPSTPTSQHQQQQRHHNPSQRKKKIHPNKPSRKVKVAKVDGDAERALSSRFGVVGFPSFYLVDGWTVREFHGNRSKENLLNFALEEYNEVEPIPFLFGPFGPMGQLKALLMRIGVWLLGLYETLTIHRGMKPLLAMSILCVCGLTIGLVLITVLGCIFLSKAKLD